jgi:hypothetical protein
MQPGKSDPSPDRRDREDGENRPGEPGPSVAEQQALLVRFGGCTVEDLAFLARQLPGAYQQLLAGEASRRRMEWADLTAQVTGHIGGLAALLILAAVAWHAIDRGAFIQAASIICTGAVSVVALFVTGRTASRKPGRSPLPEPGRDEQASRHRK